jgi:hypothetical protein
MWEKNSLPKLVPNNSMGRKRKSEKYLIGNPIGVPVKLSKKKSKSMERTNTHERSYTSAKQDQNYPTGKRMRYSIATLFLMNTTIIRGAHVKFTKNI